MKLSVEERIEKRECEYRDLWRAVLAGAIRDCFKDSRSSDKRKAMVWLFSDTWKVDRDTVCDFAGINFDCWQQDLFEIVKHMEHEDYYKGYKKGNVGSRIAKMMVMHGS